MADDATDLIIERMDAKDELTFQGGDTLDVKASIVLVVLTFLAGQSADLLTKGNLNCLQTARLIKCHLLFYFGPTY